MLKGHGTVSSVMNYSNRLNSKTKVLKYKCIMVLLDRTFTFYLNTDIYHRCLLNIYITISIELIIVEIENLQANIK